MRDKKKSEAEKGVSRRTLLKKGGLAGILGAVAGSVPLIKAAATNEEPSEFSDNWDTFFQKNYRSMTPDEVTEAIGRIERNAKKRFGVDIKVGNEPPLENVVFGYALNVAKCKGVRACVEACVEENNQGRDSQIQYIRVLEMDRGNMDLNQSNHYFDSETVPQPGKFYLPMQCMQCDNPPCVKACPVEATWPEPDGMVVIDYNWCIGCRYCMAACPYWARRFNWTKPTIPKEEINPNTHYLGNRPRDVGVVEKCTFCIQRTRKGQLPACQVACPTGARVFGNLMDPNSEIRYILKNKTVFRLKEELGTEPKFWYYTD